MPWTQFITKDVPALAFLKDISMIFYVVMLVIGLVLMAVTKGTKSKK